MLSSLIAGLRWNASLGVKFMRVVPYSTVIIVILTLISQVAMLFASFLPLKVILMLGADGTPNYFPGFLTGLERNMLIGVLSVGTLVFFLVHLLAEKTGEWTTSVATAKLLAKSQKMVLFENQEILAESSYQRYSRALASGVFITLSLVGLGYFYPEMSLFILSYFLVILLLLWLTAPHVRGIRDRLDGKRLAPFMSVLGVVGFFVAFGILVIDFVFFTPPGVIVALVSFLLIRQATNRAAGMVSDLTSLYQQKDRLSAVFFHGQVFQPAVSDSKKRPWPLLMPEVREAWVGNALIKFKKAEGGRLKSSWLQLGNNAVVGLRVNSEDEQFLFRLYPVHRSSWALHEASLMADQPAGLPGPSWVGTTLVEQFHCLIYSLETGSPPSDRQVKRISLRINTALLSVFLEQEAVNLYTRSRAMLWQRLEVGMLEQLRVAADTISQQRDLLNFITKMPWLQRLLAVLPLSIQNPEMTQYSIWVPDGGEPILLDWGRWTLEPVGAGWPEAEKTLSMLGDALLAASKNRIELAGVQVEHAELAALAFALERECNRQRYKQALELIPRILDRLDMLETSDPLETENQ